MTSRATFQPQAFCDSVMYGTALTRQRNKSLHIYHYKRELYLPCPKVFSLVISPTEIMWRMNPQSKERKPLLSPSFPAFYVWLNAIWRNIFILILVKPTLNLNCNVKSIHYYVILFWWKKKPTSGLWLKVLNIQHY